MGDFIVISFILALIGIIIYKNIKKRKNGQGSCSGCSCGSSCPASKGNCNK